MPVFVSELPRSSVHNAKLMIHTYRNLEWYKHENDATPSVSYDLLIGLWTAN